MTEACWCGDEHEPHCPTCDKCGAPVTTGMMAVICPNAEQCAFWPNDKPSQDFIRKMRGPGCAGRDRWESNGEPCGDERVRAWRDLPEPARGHWVRGLLTVALVDQPNSIISSSMVNRANMAPERCSSCGGVQRYTLMGRSICSLCGEDIAPRAPDTTPASPEG